MKVHHQRSESMQKVAELIDGIGAGMLTTPGPNQRLASRPMMPMEMDTDGCIWFFTNASEPEKQAPSGQLALTFAAPADGVFVALEGAAEMVHDRAKIEALWSPILRAWFKDKDDPDLALLRVNVEQAEYWNSSSSSLVRFLALATSAVMGEQIGMGENQTVHNPTVVSGA